MSATAQRQTSFLGIDVGTSGIRASLIDASGTELTGHRLPFATTERALTEQNPENWWRLLDRLLQELGERCARTNIPPPVAIALDGTSGSILACRQNGDPASPALMYNDTRATAQAEAIRCFAPPDNPVQGVSSSLARALWLHKHEPRTEIFCHQADWLGGRLTGRFGISDENNCLKLGYDSARQVWPDWLLANTPLTNDSLPRVVAAGTRLDPVKPALTGKYRLAEHCHLVAGTTDSNAATLAAIAPSLLTAGEVANGLAVTSLGSTLVLKLFSEKPVYNAQYGIYSHRLLGRWLVGGASNSGGAALLQYFTPQQMRAMTPGLNPDRLLNLGYYPLPASGERFPYNDPQKTNKTSPRPDSDTAFFQALLEGIADIEAEGYQKLQTLGASKLQKVLTAGGGSKNDVWIAIRARKLGVPVARAQHSEASYGVALLARHAMKNDK